MQLGDGTYVTAHAARTRVRGGGTGGNAWIARITGVGGRYGLQREFVRANKDGLSNSGKSGSLTWEIPSTGIYEYRNMCISSTTRDPVRSGFVYLDQETGEELDPSKAEVEKTFKEGQQ